MGSGVMIVWSDHLSENLVKMKIGTVASGWVGCYKTVLFTKRTPSSSLSEQGTAEVETRRLRVFHSGVQAGETPRKHTPNPESIIATGSSFYCSALLHDLWHET